MVRLTKILMLIALAGFSTESSAQFSAPKYSNEFLQIGVSARALAMGRSQVAISDDSYSGYWNPAGLSSIEAPYELSLMHAEYFAGIAKYDYAGFAMQLDSNSTLGITAIRFGIDDIPDTRFLYDANGAINYDNIRFFSAADYAFLLSYARKSIKVKGLRWGANLKVVHRVAGQFANAWGFGFDLGAQYQWKKWDFGLMARDVTSTFNAWSHNSILLRDVYNQTGNIIPENSIEVTLPSLILAGSRHIPFLVKGQNFGVRPSLDILFTFDGQRNVLVPGKFTSIDPRGGLELNYNHLVFLRAGTYNAQRIKRFDGTDYLSFQPSFGIGFRWKSSRLDYAIADLGGFAEGLTSHVFSLSIQFGQKK
jgi:hypothetical protein